jgi:transitional endoplasmic reticulum ATPase
VLFRSRVVAQLLAMMDGLKSRGKVVVIAATNIPNMIDPALRRPGRFDREIEIGVPGKEGRLDILKIHTRNMPLTKNVKLKELADRTHGFVGADLAALAREAAMVVLRRALPDMNIKDDASIAPELLEKLRIEQKDFYDALKMVRPSALREVLIEIPNVKWEDIGGMEKVKQELIEAVVWPLKNAESFTRLGISPPRGILLYGAPGTGKTLLAKAVANESESNFISVKGPEMLSKWVGESEKAIREIFKKARQAAPSIIFFDEIDSLAPRRGASSDSHVTERVVNQLLTEMDGLQDMSDVVILAATNRPDILDTALMRPGRFDRIIHCAVPNELGRFEIFKLHAARIPIKITKEEITDLEKKLKKSNDFKITEVNTEVNTIKSKLASGISASQQELDKLSKKEISKKGQSKRFKDLSDKEKVLYLLAYETDGYVGADIESVCREAAILALREDMEAKEVKMTHFIKALDKVKPSVTKDVEKEYEDLKDFFRAARGKEMKEEKPSYMG